MMLKDQGDKSFDRSQSNKDEGEESIARLPLQLS